MASTQTTRQDAGSRERLLRAAMALFAERGYHDTTIDAIASRAGISRGSIFWHFGSKDDLLGAVLAETLNNWLAAIDERTDGYHGLKALERFLGHRQELVDQDLAAVRLGHVLVGEALATKPEIAPGVIEMFDAMSERVSRWLDEAQRDAGSAARRESGLADLILFAIYGATELWLLDPGRFDLAEAYEAIRRTTKSALRS